uniref:Myblike DNAbinding protein putative n=1 Tax=Albugo laibachii Nc14 TaxID=890382 RepID=F0WQR5_9STRA|nr:myblike DNAbinding protein putative [Albugo laibachii Nc14]CCA25335.1 myblike DNAbinding protein putative [Albugo laibachii Nc14]|eukprot:CCA25335.1 myblike DNAbinding protein putative [Albugo laibachii Nc14]
MTISANVRKELFQMTSCEGKLIRIRPTEAKAGTTVYTSKQSQPLKMWTQDEHEKFLEAMEKYPTGPWKVIAAHIGTKTTRQTMTHAQKYRQKISRWRRGLRHKGRKQTHDGMQHEYTDEQSPEHSDRSMSHYGQNTQIHPEDQTVQDRCKLSELAELASFEMLKTCNSENEIVLNHPNWEARPMMSICDCEVNTGLYTGMNDIRQRGNIRRPSFDPFVLQSATMGRTLDIGLNNSTGSNCMRRCQVANMSVMNTAFGVRMDGLRDDRSTFEVHLPPINASAMVSHLYTPISPTIPPLRSKINPTVLIRAHEPQPVPHLMS